MSTAGTLSVHCGDRFEVVPFDPEMTVASLTLSVASALKKNQSRVRLSYCPKNSRERIPLAQDSRTLASYSIQSGSEILVKDLGPQIGYRTVFVAEYVGPLVIWWVILFNRIALSQLFTPTVPLRLLSIPQYLATLAWSLHYLKRLFESIFVHTFSHSTMPLRNLAKNCTYYWGFAALIAYVILHPYYTQPPLFFILLGYAIWFAGEALNLTCHLHLRSLRTTHSAGDHPIPTHPLFKLTVCPNYTFEATWTFIGTLFMFAGLAQMYMWALKKRKRYVSEHPTYPSKRPVIIPYLL